MGFFGRHTGTGSTGRNMHKTLDTTCIIRDNISINFIVNNYNFIKINK